MNKDRQIHISLTPHTWDNEKEPYFWVIMEWSGKSWVNSGLCDWAETPQKAWEQASKHINTK